MKHILITGSTGNLGTVVIPQLAKGENHLHLALRSEATYTTNNISTYKTDLLDTAQSDGLLKEITSDNNIVSAGVFLAGGFQFGNLKNTELSDIYDMIQINFGTAYTLAKKLISHFRSVGGGKLIFIGASSAMSFNTAGYNLAYSLSKQMLFNFSALINESEGDFGISSHILLPQTIRIKPENDGNADFTSPYAIADSIKNIIEGTEKKTVIEFNSNGDLNH